MLRNQIFKLRKLNSLGQKSPFQTCYLMSGLSFHPFHSSLQRLFPAPPGCSCIQRFLSSPQLLAADTINAGCESINQETANSFLKPNIVKK